jgi:internalin A
LIEADGLLIARERIAREATERTGSLDLGRLGLTALPDELFALKHLRRLNLGSGIVDKDGDGLPRSTNIARNDIEPFLGRLIELPELEILSVLGCKLTSLGGIAVLTALRQLDCSWTQVSDLQPLKDLKKLQILGCSST